MIIERHADGLHVALGDGTYTLILLDATHRDGHLVPILHKRQVFDVLSEYDGKIKAVEAARALLALAALIAKDNPDLLRALDEAWIRLVERVAEVKP